MKYYMKYGEEGGLERGSKDLTGTEELEGTRKCSPWSSGLSSSKKIQFCAPSQETTKGKDSWEGASLVLWASQ